MNDYTLWQFIDDFKFCCKKHFSTTKKNIYFYEKISRELKLTIDYSNGLIILTSNDDTKIIIDDKNNICYYNENFNFRIIFYFKCDYCDYYARYNFFMDEKSGKSGLIQYKSDKLVYDYNSYYYRNNDDYKKIDINIDLVTRESLEKIEDSLLFI